MFNNSFCRSWIGSISADMELIKHGFFVHRIYKNIILDFIKNICKSDDIDIYFLEVAKEFLSSGTFNKHNIDRGSIRTQDGYYNSEYLNKLSAKISHDNAHSIQNSNNLYQILHKGYALFLNKLEKDVTFREFILRSIKNQFELEILQNNDFEMLDNNFSPEKMFRILCAKFGFNELNNDSKIRSDPRKVYGISLQNELIIYLHLDKIVKYNNNHGGFFNAPVAIGFKHIKFRNDRQLGNMSYLVSGIERYCTNIPRDGFFVAFSAYLTCVTSIAQSVRALEFPLAS